MGVGFGINSAVNRMEVHMFRASIWGAFVLGLSVSASERYATVDAENVGPGYVTGGGEWNTGRQSVLSINLNYNVMETGSVYLGRTHIMQNLGFMAPVPYSDNITGAQANCVASSTPWRPEFAEAELRLRFPRVAYAADGGEKLGSGGGGSVVFRETARPKIIR
jgi:hypothetical protein